MTFLARAEKKLNKGYKVEQIAGKVDYFVFYVDRSSLISGCSAVVVAGWRPLSLSFRRRRRWSQSNTFFVFPAGDIAGERYANKA